MSIYKLQPVDEAIERLGRVITDTKIHELEQDWITVLFERKDMQKTIERLNARIDNYKTILETDAVDEAICRNELKAVLPVIEVDGDSSGVPALSDVVMSLIVKYIDLNARVKEIENVLLWCRLF
jgi:hypothetical protein